MVHECMYTGEGRWIMCVWLLCIPSWNKYEARIMQRITLRDVRATRDHEGRKKKALDFLSSRALLSMVTGEGIEPSQSTL